MCRLGAQTRHRQPLEGAGKEYGGKAGNRRDGDRDKNRGCDQNTGWEVQGQKQGQVREGDRAGPAQGPRWTRGGWHRVGVGGRERHKEAQSRAREGVAGGVGKALTSQLM